jgi:hypothetical protein
MIKVNDGAGNVTLSSCSFKRLTRIGTNSKGGVIEAVIGSDNGLLRVSSTFEESKVSNNDGIGGAIYIKITSNILNKFDLSGTSYSGCDAKFGKSLFIDAYNLRTAVPIHTDSS